MKTLKIKKVSFPVAKKYLLQSKFRNQAVQVKETVRKIILNVKKNGDKALIKISNKIDKTEFKTVTEASFNKSDLKKNYEKLDNAIKKNLNFIKVRGKVSLESRKSFKKTSTIEAIIKVSPTKK